MMQASKIASKREWEWEVDKQSSPDSRLWSRRHLRVRCRRITILYATSSNIKLNFSYDESWRYCVVSWSLCRLLNKSYRWIQGNSLIVALFLPSRLLRRDLVRIIRGRFFRDHSNHLKKNSTSDYSCLYLARENRIRSRYCFLLILKR